MAIKFLHTRVRVSDLDKSIDWYCRHCGFEVESRSEKSPAGNQIVHLRLPGNAHTFELCYSPEFKVEFPEDLMHTCLGVDDIIAFCDQLEKDGVEVWPSQWREKFADPKGRKMAFITDPDGYEVEILVNR